MSQEIMRALGRIEGKLDGIDKRLDTQDEQLSSIDGRLRTVEKNAAVSGAITGGIAGVGFSLLTAKVKSMLGV